MEAGAKGQCQWQGTHMMILRRRISVKTISLELLVQFTVCMDNFLILGEVLLANCTLDET